MNIRISGQKNELTTDEKKGFESLLQDKFAISNQIGRTGDKTSAYMMSDETGRRFILKIPNNTEDKGWLISQQKAYESCAKAFCKYHGNVYIPRMLMHSENFIVEEYAGEELTPDFYNKLNEHEQKAAANDLALLLFGLHNDNPAADRVAPLEMMTEPTFDVIYAYMRPAMNQEQQNMFQDLIQKFSQRDISDEIRVMTHGDLRSQNILYDIRKKRLAVIDFEGLLPRNIYHDFVPFAAASFGMSYRFLWDTINAYNSVNGQEAIDIEKVRLLHCVGILHELGRCAIFAACRNLELQLRCQYAFECVSKVLL